MPYNLDALIHEKQVVINSTGAAGVSSGSLIVEGGLSTKDTYVKGHVSVNDVKITPNLNDIVYELQAVLTPDTSIWTNIDDFYFSNSAANTFKANVNVTVSSGSPKYALYEINGVYKNTGWLISYTFTGDLTGITFGITTANGVGQIQYQNTNPVGTTTTIRYRAQTTAPAGTSPTGSTGIIQNTSGPYIADTLLYANTTNTIAGADITYASNVFKVGGPTRMVLDNTTGFTSYSNGGSLTAMGGASVAKKLIVGEKIGIANTDPGFSIDIGGDINFTGNLYKNGSLYTGSSIWDSNGSNIFNTTGNVGIGTTAPSTKLDVVGDGKFSGSITAGNVKFVRMTADGVISTDLSTGNINLTAMTAGSAQITTLSGTNINYTNVTAGALAATNALTTNITTGVLIASTGITTGSANITTLTGTNANYTSVTAGAFAATNALTTNITTGVLIASTGITTGSAQITTLSGTDINYTNVTAGALVSTNALTTNITTGVLIASTGITTGSAQITTLTGTNANYTNVTAGALASTNVVASNISTGVLIASTGITTGSANITTLSGTNANYTNVTAGGMTATNVVTSNISTGVLIASTGITSGSAKITNIDVTNITIGNIQDLTISGNLTVSGTTTTVNTETVNVEDNLLVVNSGPAGLADGGLLIKRYISGTSGSVNYAGIFYKESTDEITLATTNTDPGTNEVTIDSYLPLKANILNLVSTSNASSSSVGGALTVPGGAAITKDLYVGGVAYLPNISSTNITTSTLRTTNEISTNISTGVLIASTGITTGSANITTLTNTNLSTTNITASTLRTTNEISTNISTGVLLASTGITSASAIITNLNTTNITTSTLRTTDFIATNISTGTLEISTKIDAFGNSNTVGNIFTTGGNVGIGTTAPSYTLHVTGTIYASGDITALSDMRYKTDIKTVDDALAKVNNLRGVYFKSIQNDRENVGVIAQETEIVVPEVVLTDVNGNKSVAYGNMVGVLIEAIKELSEKVRKLEENQCKCL